MRLRRLARALPLILVVGLVPAVPGPVAAEASTSVDYVDRAYTPLNPARILDTRTGTGSGGPRRVGADSAIDVQVTGVGGVPAGGVGAVVFNLTGTAPSTATYVTAFPTGQPRPTASNLNLSAGQTAPNLVVAKVGAGGKVSLYNAGGSVDLIMDVVGWFAEGPDYTGVNPARVLDTRTARKVGPNASIDVQVTGVGGVPADGVGAVVFNLTGTEPTSSTYVTAYPAGEARPTASNLNLLAGQTAPNLVVAKVGAGGKVSLYNAGGSTHLIADVVGWLPVGSDYSGVNPARVLDTRTGTGSGTARKVGPNASIDVQVTGVGGVPADGVGAVVFNLTGTEPTSSTYVTAYPAGEARPTASNLNLLAGQTTPNLVVAKVGAGGKVSLYNAGGSTHLIADVVGWISTGVSAHLEKPATTAMVDPGKVTGVSGADLTVSGTPVPVGDIVAVAPSVSVPDGLLGRVASTAPGGNGTTVLRTTPVRFDEAFPSGTMTGSVDTRSLAAAAPSSLAKSLAGKALQADREGRIAITGAQVAKCSPAVIQVEADIQVQARVVFDIDWNALGLNRLTLEFAFEVTGSIGMTAGAALSCEFPIGPKIPLPPMAMLKSSAQPKIKVDLLGGVPMAAQFGGGFRIGARYTKGSGVAWVHNGWVGGSYTPPTSIGAGKARVAFGLETDVKLLGIAGPTFYGALFGEVKVDPWSGGPWWTLDGGATGEIGLDIDLWFANISYKLAALDFLRLTLSRSPGPWPGPRLSDVDLSDGYVNQPYDATVAVTGGVAPLTLTRSYGSLPPGLTLTGNHIAGTPTAAAAGEWTFTLTLTDAQGRSDNRTVSLRIWPPPPLTVSTSSLRAAVVDRPYTATVQAVGGKPPYTFQVTGLPAPLSADPAGAITGTPTAPGRFPLTVKVTDKDGTTASRQLDLVVGWTIPNAELISISITGDPGNGESSSVMTSSNGRYVYFMSTATDLVAAPAAKTMSVYVRDRVAGTTTRVLETDFVHELLAVSSNGRFALLAGDGEPMMVRRYDRTTGALTELALGFNRWHDSYRISDDGDLVYTVGIGLYRISSASWTRFRCPDGTNLRWEPWEVRFVGDASVVYFVTADCGQYQLSVFRYSRTTDTTTLVHRGDCYFNGGNSCYQDVQPTLNDAHLAVTRINVGGEDTLILDRMEVAGVDKARYLCGLREDGKEVAFTGLSTMLPGGNEGNLDLYDYQVGAAVPTRIGPPSDHTAELFTHCTGQGMASTTGELAFVSAGQAYVL